MPVATETLSDAGAPAQPFPASEPPAGAARGAMAQTVSQASRVRRRSPRASFPTTSSQSRSCGTSATESAARSDVPRIHSPASFAIASARRRLVSQREWDGLQAAARRVVCDGGQGGGPVLRHDHAAHTEERRRAEDRAHVAGILHGVQRQPHPSLLGIAPRAGAQHRRQRLRFPRLDDGVRGPLPALLGVGRLDALAPSLRALRRVSGGCHDRTVHALASAKLRDRLPHGRGPAARQDQLPHLPGPRLQRRQDAVCVAQLQGHVASSTTARVRRPGSGRRPARGAILRAARSRYRGPGALSWSSTTKPRRASTNSCTMP